MPTVLQVAEILGFAPEQQEEEGGAAGVAGTPGIPVPIGSPSTPGYREADTPAPPGPGDGRGSRDWSNTPATTATSYATYRDPEADPLSPGNFLSQANRR